MYKYVYCKYIYILYVYRYKEIRRTYTGYNGSHIWSAIYKENSGD